jgi:hypothetical protein
MQISKELWWNASRQARPLLLLSPDSKAKAILHQTAMHHLVYQTTPFPFLLGVSY